jgi:hypothetical protein
MKAMAGKKKKAGAAKKAAGKKGAASVDKSFIFRDVVSIPKSMGLKACTLKELRDTLAVVSEECIFHHTYQYFSKGHIQEYTNDFAHWAGENLEERALAEHLSNIDPYSFRSVGKLREELLKVADYYIVNFPSPRDVLPGEEFFFSESISFVFPTGIRARNLAEFLIALKFIDASSIYYHFYEARIRLKKEADDFSKWVDEVIGAADIAEEIKSIDPFMHNLKGIREHLVEIIERGLREQMEVVQ